MIPKPRNSENGWPCFLLAWLELRFLSRLLQAASDLWRVGMTQRVLEVPKEAEGPACAAGDGGKQGLETGGKSAPRPISHWRSTWWQVTLRRDARTDQRGGHLTYRVSALTSDSQALQGGLGTKRPQVNTQHKHFMLHKYPTESSYTSRLNSRWWIWRVIPLLLEGKNHKITTDGGQHASWYLDVGLPAFVFSLGIMIFFFFNLKWKPIWI